MKIKSRTLQIITLSLAAIIILVSILSATHVLSVDLKFLDEMTTYLLIIGVGLIVWDGKSERKRNPRRPKKRPRTKKLPTRLTLLPREKPVRMDRASRLTGNPTSRALDTVV